MRLSHLKTSAPSSTLLRYLRSQSENLCLPPTKAEPSSCHCAPFRELTVHSGSRRTRDHASSKLTSIEVQRPKPVEPCILRADLLRPRVKLRKLTPLPSTVVTRPSLYDSCAVRKQQSRHASTSSHPWLRRLWDFRSRTGQTRLKPDDLPPLTSFLDEGP